MRSRGVRGGLSVAFVVEVGEAEVRFAEALNVAFVAGTWVIDGNYAATLPIRLQRATHAIFLDLPATTCLWGIAQRRWRYRGGQHDTTGVFDRITWGFLTYIWGYRREMAPRVRALLTEHASHAQVHIVRSRRAANRLTEQLHSAGQLTRVDMRTESHGKALDDIETYVTETAQQLARAAAEPPATSDAPDTKTGQGVDMRTLVPWVENNITTLVARKVPTTDGAPKWCQCWWDHAEAIARLEALRRAWVALSGVEGIGLVTYFDYLDRTLSVLTSDTGPFARCGPRHHTVERTLGHIPPPPEVYGDPSPEAPSTPVQDAAAP